MFNQEYLPCNRQIHIKLSDEELKMIRDRMEQMGFKNMSAYIRKNGNRWILHQCRFYCNS